jgi:hypothetical protein
MVVRKCIASVFDRAVAVVLEFSGHGCILLPKLLA